MISIAFISCIVKSRRRGTIKWRGREYVITEKYIVLHTHYK